jgi:hypothetical protein
MGEEAQKNSQKKREDMTILEQASRMGGVERNPLFSLPVSTRQPRFLSTLKYLLRNTFCHVLSDASREFRHGLTGYR